MSNVHQYHIVHKDGTESTVDESNVLHELYYGLAVLNKNKYTNEELENAKVMLSMIETEIPMFDIFSKNFYLITASNIFTRVNNHHYRIPSKKSIEVLNRTLKQIESVNDPKLKNASKDYCEKIQKNINFIENFNLNVLKNQYYKLFYLSHPTTSDLTSCVKPSFISFITSKPYYTKSELVNLALNMGLDISTKLDSTNEICEIVSKNDITANEIITHQLYIQERAYKSYIQLYTLLGSYYWNFYLRNKCLKDRYVEDQIDKLYGIIKGSPAFKHDYWLYRFVEDDSYLADLKVGDIFDENSFISTTRNPFYDPKNNLFGFILIKIKVPKEVSGVGLCIESYSLFPNEEEILMNPSRLKLVEITNNFKYYHPNPKASKRIRKLYVFELVEPIKQRPSITTRILSYEESSYEIPTIDWLSSRLYGDDFASKVYHFYRNVLHPFNNKRYFYSKIGNVKYLFQAFYIDDSQIYEKYFFLQNKSRKSSEEIYFILQNEKSGEIDLIIELRDIISVNYIHKFIGSGTQFNENDLVLFLSSMARYFGIDQIIIHNEYKSYLNIATSLLRKNPTNILDQTNPDDKIISLYSGDFKYYNSDFIQFVEHGGKERRFNGIPGITFNLKRHHVNFMYKMNVEDLFKEVVKTPLYNIMLKYQKSNGGKKVTLRDFYIYIHYNNFYLLPELNSLIALYNNDLFENYTDNPWSNSYFTLRGEEYLYENGIINHIETFQTNIYQDYLKKLSADSKGITFNSYRLGLLL